MNAPPTSTPTADDRFADLDGSAAAFGRWYDGLESGNAKGNRSRIVRVVNQLLHGYGVVIPGFVDTGCFMSGVKLRPDQVVDRWSELVGSAVAFAPNKKSARGRALPEGSRVDRSNGFALVHPLKLYRRYLLDLLESRTSNGGP